MKRIFILTIDEFEREGKSAKLVNCEVSQISLIEVAQILPVLIAQEASKKAPENTEEK